MSFINAEQKTATEKVLYTGLAEMNVDIINPTSAQLAQMFKSDPKPVNYITEFNGQQSTKLDIYLSKQDPAIRTKMTLFISGRDRVSANSGKKQFINGKGVSCWGTSLEEIQANPSMSWFDTSTARVAKEGEADLYNFLIKLFNIDTKSPNTNLTLNWPMLLTGNATELNQSIEYFKLQKNQNTIKVLLGVKDGKYQDVYSKEFMAANTNVSTQITAAAKNEYSGFKSYWAGSTQLKPFDPQAIVSEAIPANTAPVTMANPFETMANASMQDGAINPFE